MAVIFYLLLIAFLVFVAIINDAWWYIAFIIFWYIIYHFYSERQSGMICLLIGGIVVIILGIIFHDYALFAGIILTIYSAYQVFFARKTEEAMKKNLIVGVITRFEADKTEGDDKNFQKKTIYVRYFDKKRVVRETRIEYEKTSLSGTVDVVPIGKAVYMRKFGNQLYFSDFIIEPNADVEELKKGLEFDTVKE